VLGPDDLVGPDKAVDHDPLKIVLDLHETGRAGYQANEWLPEHELVDVGMSDLRRLAAQLTVADDEWTAHRLIAAIRALLDHLDEVPPAKPISPRGEWQLVDIRQCQERGQRPRPRDLGQHRRTTELAADGPAANPAGPSVRCRR
jgi:arginine/lysine/ornithine decarboxylase